MRKSPLSLFLVCAHSYLLNGDCSSLAYLLSTTTSSRKMPSHDENGSGILMPKSEKKMAFVGDPMAFVGDPPTPCGCDFSSSSIGTRRRLRSRLTLLVVCVWAMPLLSLVGPITKTQRGTRKKVVCNSARSVRPLLGEIFFLPGARTGRVNVILF